MHPIYTAQLLTYLKLTGLRRGLLVNFNVPLIRDGIRRIVFKTRLSLCLGAFVVHSLNP